MPLMDQLLYFTCLYYRIQAEKSTSVWDILFSWQTKTKARKLVELAMAVKASAQNRHISPLLTFHWSKVVIWPSLLSMGWGGLRLTLGGTAMNDYGERYLSPLEERQRSENSNIICAAEWDQIFVVFYFVLLISALCWIWGWDTWAWAPLGTEKLCD